ncbi:mitochondrial ribosomal protein S25-domain-containing protein [Mycena polygramma]|nr:mitochondrial ribosomal protein S25-domain-containing protein [Mycena polygramma]
MGRRIASQVHHQVARLMRGRVIETEPKWYQAVLNFPPLPLPAKAPPLRTAFDRKMQPVSESGRQPKLRRPKNRPMPIHYIEDDIRRQFYADHPFEAFRPVTLVEKGDIQQHEVNGEEWTRLRHRGRNPTAEDAIQFALNLHLNLPPNDRLPLSQAYARAIAQFRSLRSEHHIATTFAVLEAEALGGVFGHGEIEHAFEKEKRALATWEKLDDMDEGALASRKRWKMIADRHAGESDWSRGVQYVKMWQAGVRVNYSPPMTTSVKGLLDDEDAEIPEPRRKRESSNVGSSDLGVKSKAPSADDLDILTAEELDGLLQHNEDSDLEDEDGEDMGEWEEESIELDGLDQTAEQREDSDFTKKS